MGASIGETDATTDDAIQIGVLITIVGAGLLYVLPKATEYFRPFGQTFLF